MKRDNSVIVLCGGKGTRLSEETSTRPKPMVNIGTHPILWHILMYYGYYGFNNFCLALGYKASYIKEYFLLKKMVERDMTIEFGKSGNIKYYTEYLESDWRVSLIDTGENNLKGSRIKQLEPYIVGDNFFVTYGDGLSDVDINKLYQFHLSHGKMATVTAVRPPSRFGELNIADNTVINFEEKPQMGKGYINGGFFVFKREFLEFLTVDAICDLEFGALQAIAEQGELMAYRHDGFWQCMDNIREKQYLESLVESESAPWIKWK